MKALVTGGAGFIGSHLVDALVNRKWNVTVLDNFLTGRPDNIKHNEGHIKVIQEDVRSERTAEIIRSGNFDVIFHLAAMVDVTTSNSHPKWDADTNIIGTINVLDAAFKCSHIPRIVFSSSCAVYGDALCPNEYAPKYPLSPYGLSKRCAEEYINFFQSKGVVCAVLRYANVYGPRQGANGEGGVVSVFAKNIWNGDPLIIYGDGEQTRDFVYVEDVVRANIMAAEIPLDESLDESFVWNIGTGDSVSINALAKEMHEQTLEISDGSVQPVIKYEPKRTGEIRDSYLNCSYAFTELNWTPYVQLRDGLHETLKWFRNNP